MAQAFEGNTSGHLSTDIYRHAVSCIFFQINTEKKNHIPDLLPPQYRKNALHVQQNHTLEKKHLLIYINELWVTHSQAGPFVRPLPQYTVVQLYLHHESTGY